MTNKAITEEQWFRYRSEIHRILQASFEVDYNGKKVSLNDFFSEITIKEMENREPFEGMDTL